ncbi:MAG TPA: hypothetical protein VGV18_04290, partial [Verrucomicrobiae bacterium]|nr:hypothetical protein [Verrucomicrobiae bacterium]
MNIVTQQAMNIICRAFLAAAFVSALTTALPLHGQTTEAWASLSDNYTNGPIGGDWNPAIADSLTNWPDNDNGSASSLGGYIVVIT